MDSARHQEPPRGRAGQGQLRSARGAVVGRAGRLHDALSAYLFLSPSLLIIAVFGIFPLFFTFSISLFKWRLTRGGFLGLGNYESLFGARLLPLLALAASIAGIAAAVLLLHGTAAQRRAGLRRAGGSLSSPVPWSALCCPSPALHPRETERSLIPCA